MGVSASSLYWEWTPATKRTAAQGKGVPSLDGSVAVVEEAAESHSGKSTQIVLGSVNRRRFLRPGKPGGGPNIRTMRDINPPTIQGAGGCPGGGCGM